MQIADKVVDKIAKHHKYIAGIMFLLILIFGVSGQCFFEKQKIEKFESFLKKTNSDNLKFTSEIRMNRIQFLTEQTQQQIANIEEARSNREDLRIQSRNIYSAILIALLTLIFMKDMINDNARPLFCLLSILFAITMYYFDVHSVDMISRITAPNEKNSDAYRELINISPTDSAWYSLDYSSIPGINTINDSLALKRKLINSSFPTLEQIIFYLLPILIFIFLLFGKKVMTDT